MTLKKKFVSTKLNQNQRNLRRCQTKNETNSFKKWMLFSFLLWITIGWIISRFFIFMIFMMPMSGSFRRRRRRRWCTYFDDGRRHINLDSENTWRIFEPKMILDRIALRRYRFWTQLSFYENRFSFLFMEPICSLFWTNTRLFPRLTGDASVHT